MPNKLIPIRRWEILLAFAFNIVAVIIVAILVTHNNNRVSNLTHCLARWGDRQSVRDILTENKLIERTDALDRLVRSVDTLVKDGTPKAERNFHRDLHYYVRKSNEAKNAYRDHPVPPPPKLVCDTDGRENAR